MKTERMELRLDSSLRQKLNELAKVSGTPASRVIRRLILAAYRNACGETRATKAPSPTSGYRMDGKAVCIVATEEGRVEANLSTDELLIQAGFGLPDHLQVAPPASEGS